MRVSVVIPAYNAEAFLASTIDSVLGQSFADLEVIVVDDGSSDATAAVATAAGPRVTLARGPRQGVSAARNEGIRIAKGDLIAFMDHDDLWLEEKVARQVAAFDADPRVELVFTQAVVEEGGVAREVFPVIPEPATFLHKAYENLVHWNYIPMSSVMARRDRLTRLPDPPGPFDAAFKLAEDWDLWLRLAGGMGEGGMRFIAEPLTRYVIVPGRATERMADLRLEDIAIFERELSAKPWLLTSDPARCRATRYRLHEEAGYWLLREGRQQEARAALKRAWRSRPWSIKPLAWIAASIGR